MNYSKIKNPETNRYVSLKSNLGKSILKKYIDQVGGSDARAQSIYDGYSHRDAYIYKKIPNENINLKKNDQDRLAIMDLINFESGYNRHEIGTRIFDKVKSRTKEIGLDQESKIDKDDMEELDQTMFLYGYPTPDIINLLKDITKANNDRVGFIDDEHQAYRIPDLFKTRKKKFNQPGNIESDGDKEVMFMTGFVQIGSDIYSTISDKVDKKYMKNVKAYVILLNKCNFKVIFNDRETALLPEYIKELLLEIEEQQSQNTETTTKEIRFVFNIKNIKQTKRHIPFKRWIKGVHSLGGPQYNCVNGSLCVESKLFTYLFSENVINSYDDIDGAIAYWIRNNTKKYGADSPIKGYCYGDFKEHHSTHKLMLDMMVDKGKLPSGYTDDDLLLFDMVRGFALPCPGCQKNFYNYITNDIYDWDYSNCQDWDGTNWTWLKEPVD